jgi:signal transduction histidine kinase
MLSPSELHVDPSNRQFIREISHALNTPISYIEVLLEAAAANTKNAPDITNLISELQSSVNICKAYLASFRGMALISGASSLWSPASLDIAIKSAFAVYTKAAAQELSLAASLPDRIRGYANHLIISIMLPLLENAIDASPPRSEIVINYQDNNGVAAISVTNLTSDIPSAEILKDGFTTKPGHDGLGLTIVKHVLLNISGAALAFKVDDVSQKVTFTVNLPTEVAK